MRYMLILTVGLFLFAQSPNIVKPKPLHKQVPEYPEDARKLHVEGNIYLSALIGIDGSVKETELMQAIIAYAGVSKTLHSMEDLKVIDQSHRSAARKLITTAHTTAKKWKFISGTVDGKPEETMIMIPFTFTLNNTPQVVPKYRLKK